jgi:hypothetical protein
MKINTKLIRILALVPLLLYDSAKALEEPTSLAAGMTSSVKIHRDLANTTDDSLPFEQWLQDLDQVQELEDDKYGVKDKVREIILLAQESTLDDEPIINYESVDLNDIKRFQKKIKTLLHKAESQSMVVLEEDEKVDLTAAYSSARDILEATQGVLEEMRQGSGVIDSINQILGMFVVIIIPMSASILLALPVAILALLSLLLGQAQYCAFAHLVCPPGSFMQNWRGILLWPLCLAWGLIDWFFIPVQCYDLLKLESEYNEFLRDTIPLLINAVRGPETVP